MMVKHPCKYWDTCKVHCRNGKPTIPPPIPKPKYIQIFYCPKFNVWNNNRTADFISRHKCLRKQIKKKIKKDLTGKVYHYSELIPCSRLKIIKVKKQPISPVVCNLVNHGEKDKCTGE